MSEALRGTTHESITDDGCTVCGSTHLRPWHPAEIDDARDVAFSYTFSPEHSKTFQIIRCLACSHAFAHPVPRDIAAHYKDVVDNEYLKHETSRRLSAKNVLNKLDKYCRGRRLLDVGCATGDFLLEARAAGFEVEGLELSQWSSELAQRRQIEVHRSYLDELANKRPAFYDVVTLWGVIEHFARPREEVRHISSLLKPGGILALWTGDVDSVTSRLMGRRWWYWQGQHIQYFTRRSLESLARQADLCPVYSGVFPFAASFDTLANSLRRYRLRPLFMPLVRAACAVKQTWFLRLPGEMFTIFEKRTPLASSQPLAGR